MRKRSKLLILCLLLLCAGLASAFDDKEEHFVASAGFGAAAETILHYGTEIPTVKRVCLATVLGVVPGVVKELIDESETNNEFDEDDLAADALGAFTGAVISSVFNSVVQIDISGEHDRWLKISINLDF